MSKLAKYVRDCAHRRAKDWSHRSMSRWRSASSNVPTIWRLGATLQEPGTRLYIQAGKPSHRQLRQKNARFARVAWNHIKPATSWRSSTSCSGRVLFTSSAQWRRNCALRWRPRVEELTRWGNDPPLADEHGNVQRDSRFPGAIHLWAC